eukprot:10397115-Ditylum_brightwellii.AAC.1
MENPIIWCELYKEDEEGQCDFDDNEEEEKKVSQEEEEDHPKLWSEPLSPYLGLMSSIMEIREAIGAAAPWIQVDPIKDDNYCFEIMAHEIKPGGVIA